MFKLKKITWRMLICMLAIASFSLQSCSSDDESDDPSEDCTAAFESQTAAGNFLGDTFTLVQGTATKGVGDSTEFRITLYGETVIGDACDGFNFEKPDSSIIFSIPMIVGTYELGANYTVTFNDASVVNVASGTISACGAVEITEVTASEVKGKIDATGADGESFINGNFAVPRCF